MEFKVTKSQWAAAAWGADPHVELIDQQKEESVLPKDFECHCNIFPGGDNQAKDRVFISDNEWCLSDQFYRATMLLDLSYTEWIPGDGISWGKNMGMRRSAKTMAERFLTAGKEAGYDTDRWVSGY